jgi:hypothetical protein
MTDEAANIVTFCRAKREGSHVLISMEATSGRGKTHSALLLGRGIVGPTGKLGLLDTETGRGKIFAETIPGGYEYGELTPPFSPERYVSAIKNAADAGLECLIIDSASHEWEGIGGIGEIAEGAKTSSGGEMKGLAKWAKPKARHKRFVQALLTTRMHIIVCLRAKEKLIQNGTTIVSGGWVPVQEKMFGYEMTVRLFFPEGVKPGVPELVKCPADLMAAFTPGAQVSVESGARIADWVRGGAPVDEELFALKSNAEEAAEGGGEVLDKYLLTLTKGQKAKLAPFGANLRSIAQTADKEAADSQGSDDGIPSFGGGSEAA